MDSGGLVTGRAGTEAECKLPSGSRALSGGSEEKKRKAEHENMSSYRILKTGRKGEAGGISDCSRHDTDACFYECRDGCGD